MSNDPETALRRKVEPPGATTALWSMTVVDGADAGRSILVDGTAPQNAFVGSGPGCDLRVGDPLVSRRHLSIDPCAEGLRLVDLGSKNGTYVGHVRLTTAILEGPNLVRLGDTTLRVEPRSKPASVPLPSRMKFGRVIGASVEMRRLFPLCERLAASDVPVVIEGETGTGKEVLAEALHEASARANGPFVVFDCTAVPDNLIESALFGHERGAFTGAVAMRRGVFEQAHGGTLLIDEIADLEVGLQSKLLRALERAEVQRVGGDRFMKVDVRVLAATRRDLDREIAAGRFRDDLYYRLAVARITLPALRQRGGDIALLAAHFWQQLAGVPPMPTSLLAQFEAYSWPGNVRELRNAVARKIALGDLASFDERIASQSPELSADFLESVLALELGLPVARQRVVEEFERRYVERVLARHGGNVLQAAAASGIARRYFYKLKARLGA